MSPAQLNNQIIAMRERTIVCITRTATRHSTSTLLSCFQLGHHLPVKSAKEQLLSALGQLVVSSEMLVALH